MQAEDYLLLALEDEQAKSRLEAALLLIELYQRQNRFLDALMIIDYSNLEAREILEEKRGDILLAQGEYALARTCYLENLRGERLTRKLGFLEALEGGQWLKLEGRVSYLGNPLEGVRVFAHASSLAASRGEEFVDYAFTDQEGFFSFYLEAASYSLSLELTLEQKELVEGTYLEVRGGEIDLRDGQKEVAFNFVPALIFTGPGEDYIYQAGPLEITWAPYKGAQSYALEIQSLLKKDEKGYWPSPFIPWQACEECSYLFSGQLDINFGSLVWDEEGVLPSYFFNRPQAFDFLLFTLYAIDQDGQIIASSRPLNFTKDDEMPGLVKVKEGQRNKGEELLLKRQYQAALSFLEGRVFWSRNDLDSLWTLAHIYRLGGKSQKGQEGFTDFCAQDLVKCQKILKRIAKIEGGTRITSILEQKIWLEDSIYGFMNN